MEKKLVVWDIKSRKTCVEFPVAPIQCLEYLSFGGTECNIIAAGHTNDAYFSPRAVVVWELEMNATSHSMQALMTSDFVLSPGYAAVLSLCYSPTVNALFFVGQGRC